MDDRSRVLSVVATTIILVGVLVGYFAFRRHDQATPSAASIASTPNIESIPGGAATTAQYAKSVSISNVEAAKEAAQKGTSAVPTLIRPEYEGPVSFNAPATEKACSVEALKRARAAGVQAFELRCKGCDAAALRAAGYTAGELRAAGFTAKQLNDAGYSAKALLDGGYTPDELKGGGLGAKALLDSGVTPSELLQAGYKADDLKAAGVSEAAIKSLTSTPSNMPKTCSVDDLKKARAEGISAAAIRKRLECSAAAFKAAGYSAKDLRDAGFSAKALKDAGFSADELKKAGFTAGQLNQAGLGAQALLDSGFTPKDLHDAGIAADALKAAGVGPSDLKKAGYSDGDLVRAGFSQDQINPVPDSVVAFPKDCSSDSLKKAQASGISAKAIEQKLGCSLDALRAAGYSEQELAAAGLVKPETKSWFPPDCTSKSLSEAHKEGISAKAIKKRLNCSASALKAAGYNLQELLGAGYSPRQLQAAGFAVGKSLTDAFAQLPDVETDSSTAFVEQLRKQQAERLSSQQREDTLQKVAQAMTTQAGSLLTAWAPPAKQRYVKGEQQESSANLSGGSPGAGTAGENATESGSNADQGPAALRLKAGSILFAVLDTGINSDEKSPIRATITTGRLKGALLIGQFSRTDKKVVLSFTRLSYKKLKQSITLNAVAIDPDTARTALASSVNSHYMLRYGTLFASAFLSGLSDSISQSGTTTVAQSDGATTRTFPPLNSTEKALVALGEVGKQYSTVLKENFSTPPTVRVKAHSSLGILLMDDLAISESLLESGQVL